MAYKINENCVNCGACEGACPVGCISEGEERRKINPEMCISCGTCAGVCPVGAPVPNEE